ncbi:hypothetical protein FI667_g9068, partial [Globisporangium splendens]
MPICKFASTATTSARATTSIKRCQMSSTTPIRSADPTPTGSDNLAFARHAIDQQREALAQFRQQQQRVQDHYERYEEFVSYACDGDSKNVVKPIGSSNNSDNDPSKLANPQIKQAEF